MVKELILKVCGAMKKHVIPIIETFVPSDDMMDSFIAPADGDLYGSIINKVYTSPKAFERTKIWRRFYE